MTKKYHVTCPKCNGSRHYYGSGFNQLAKIDYGECFKCNGEGKIWSDKPEEYKEVHKYSDKPVLTLVKVKDTNSYYKEGYSVEKLIEKGFTTEEIEKEFRIKAYYLIDKNNNYYVFKECGVGSLFEKIGDEFYLIDPSDSNLPIDYSLFIDTVVKNNRTFKVIHSSLLENKKEYDETAKKRKIRIN